jgi:anti-anti-sigma factor
VPTNRRAELRFPSGFERAATVAFRTACNRAFDDGAETVVLDMTDVTMLDSTAIDRLRNLAARCSERGGKLMLRRLDKDFADLLTHTLFANGVVIVTEVE